jgi:hypothetical protein
MLRTASIVVCLALATAGCATDYDGTRDRAVEQALAGANNAKAQLEDLVDAPELPRGDALLEAVRQEVPDNYDDSLIYDEDVVSTKP